MTGLIQIFYQPGKVFEYVREQRAWVVALIANLLLMTIFLAVVQEAIGYTNIARQQIENSSFTKNMTADQKEQAIAAADTPTRKMIGTVAAPVVIAVIMIIFALLYMAIAGMSGGPIKFPQAMGTVSYSAWPFNIITVLLSSVVVFISADRTILDPQHLLAFNVGAFLDKATTSKPLYALASSFDVLMLAQMAFAAWGLSIVAKITFGKAIAGLIVIWIAITVLRIGSSFFF
jgi:Yip1 domain